MGIHDRDYMKSYHRREAWARFMGSDRWPKIIAASLVLFFFIDYFTRSPSVRPDDSRLIPLLGLSIDALAGWQIWTLFTYPLVHASLWHLFGNALVTFSIGRGVSYLVTDRGFLVIYGGGVVVGALAGLLFAFFSSPNALIIGASGGTFAILFALITAEPDEHFYLFPFPIRIKRRHIAYALIAISFLGAGAQLIDRFAPFGYANFDSIAHLVHLGGAAFGWYYIRALGYGNPPPSIYPRSSREAQLTPPARRRRKVPSSTRTSSKKGQPKLSIVRPDSPHLPLSIPSDPAQRQRFIEQYVDPVLDKMRRHGVESLTPEERKLLDLTSKHL